MHFWYKVLLGAFIPPQRIEWAFPHSPHFMDPFSTRKFIKGIKL